VFGAAGTGEGAGAVSGFEAEEVTGAVSGFEADEVTGWVLEEFVGLLVGVWADWECVGVGKRAGLLGSVWAEWEIGEVEESVGLLGFGLCEEMEAVLGQV
jgi:hypothetical protein